MAHVKDLFKILRRTATLVHNKKIAEKFNAMPQKIKCTEQCKICMVCLVILFARWCMCPPKSPYSVFIF